MNPYSIPVRDVTITDEVLVANGKSATIRRVVEPGEPDTATLYVGGWRVGEYKTEAGVLRRAAAELDGFTAPHPNAPVRWWFTARPEVGQQVGVATAYTNSFPRPKTGTVTGTYVGPTAIDGQPVYLLRDAMVGSVPMPEIALPVSQHDIVRCASAVTA